MSTPERNPAPRGWRDRPWRSLWAAGTSDPILLVGFSSLVVMLHARIVGQASVFPYSDASSHLAKALSLREELQYSPSPIDWLYGLLFSADSYPNFLAAVSQPFLEVDSSIASARLSLVTFTLAHAAVAVLVGRGLWGRLGAWTYTAWICFAPLLLAYSGVYMIDVALVAPVGICAILVERSNGFRHPGLSVAFAAVAACGLLTKWTWFLFLAPPVFAAVALAVWTSHRSWLGRVGSAVLLTAGSLGVCYLIVHLGRSGFTHLVDGRGVPRWLPLFLFALGVSVALGWPWFARWRASKEHPVPPVANLAVVGICVVLTAGTWYTLGQLDLWDRLDHERGQAALREVGPRITRRVWGHVMNLTPAPWILLTLSLVGVVLGRRGGWAFATRVVAIILAVTVMARTIPPDPRYILPVAPLLMGACVAGWRGLPRSLRIGAGATLISLAVLGSLLPRFGRFPAAVEMRVEPSDPGWGVGELAVPGLRRVLTLPVGIQSQPPSGDLRPQELEQLLSTLRGVCGQWRCEAHYVSVIPDVQGRALEIVSRFGGVPLEVLERGPPNRRAGVVVVKPSGAPGQPTGPVEAGEVLWAAPPGSGKPLTIHAASGSLPDDRPVAAPPHSGPPRGPAPHPSPRTPAPAGR